MANDFTALTAAVAGIAANVDYVAQVLRNPDINNNDQATIDALATKLETASAALKAAGDAEVAEDTPAPAPAPTPAPVVNPTPAPVVAPVEGSAAEEATETSAFELGEDATAGTTTTPAA